MNNYTEYINGLLGVYDKNNLDFESSLLFRKNIIFGNSKLITCPKCKNIKEVNNFSIYHVDGNSKNNLISNLNFLCDSCKRVKHSPLFVNNYTFKVDNQTIQIQIHNELDIEYLKLHMESMLLLNNENKEYEGKELLIYLWVKLGIFLKGIEYIKLIEGNEELILYKQDLNNFVSGPNISNYINDDLYIEKYL